MEYKDLNIHEHFKRGKALILVLPPMKSETIYNSSHSPGETFIESLTEIIKTLSKNQEYIYTLEFALFMHTNDKEKDKTLIHMLLPIPGMHPSELTMEMVGILQRMRTIYSMFNYHGYDVCHKENLDFDKFRGDPNAYAIQLARILEKEITKINDSPIGSMIEPKRYSVLIVTRKSLSKS
jgi:hypothetical protein